MPPPPPEPVEYSNVPGDFPPPPSPVSSSYSELRRATYHDNPSNHSNFNADYGVYGTSSQVIPFFLFVFTIKYHMMIMLKLINRHRHMNQFMNQYVQDLHRKHQIILYMLHMCLEVKGIRKNK